MLWVSSKKADRQGAPRTEPYLQILLNANLSIVVLTDSYCNLKIGEGKCMFSYIKGSFFFCFFFSNFHFPF